MVDAPDEVAALFAEHFTSGNGLSSDQMPSVPVACLSSSPSSVSSTLESITFAPGSVSTTASKIEPSQSPGPDHIAPIFFKTVAQHTLPSLTKVLQDLFDANAAPDACRRSLIAIVYKGKGKPTDEPQHYCPVSIMRIICRTFKRVVKKQLLDFLEHTSYFSNAQPAQVSPQL